MNFKPNFLQKSDKPKLHETMNYAEMDLVPSDIRPPPPGTPTQYIQPTGTTMVSRSQIV